MKKQFILFLVLSTFATLACEQELSIPYENTQNPVELSLTNMYFFRPLSAQAGEDITIFGEHFEPKSQKYEVHFDDRYAEITHTDSYSISVRVPDNLLPGEYDISLYINGQKITPEDVFRVSEKDLN